MFRCWQRLQGNTEFLRNLRKRAPPRNPQERRQLYEEVYAARDLGNFATGDLLTATRMAQHLTGLEHLHSRVLARCEEVLYSRHPTLLASHQVSRAFYALAEGSGGGPPRLALGRAHIYRWESLILESLKADKRPAFWRQMRSLIRGLFLINFQSDPIFTRICEQLDDYLVTIPYSFVQTAESQNMGRCFEAMGQNPEFLAYFFEHYYFRRLRKPGVHMLVLMAVSNVDARVTEKILTNMNNTHQLGSYSICFFFEATARGVRPAWQGQVDAQILEFKKNLATVPNYPLPPELPALILQGLNLFRDKGYHHEIDLQIFERVCPLIREPDGCIQFLKHQHYFQKVGRLKGRPLILQLGVETGELYFWALLADPELKDNAEAYLRENEEDPFQASLTELLKGQPPNLLKFYEKIM